MNFDVVRCEDNDEIHQEMKVDDQKQIHAASDNQNGDKFILERVELANGDKFKVLALHYSDPLRDTKLREELQLMFSTLIKTRTEFSKIAGPEVRIEGKMWLICEVKRNKFNVKEAYTKEVDAQTSCLKRIATYYTKQYGKNLMHIKWNPLHYLMFGRLKKISVQSGIRHMYVNYAIDRYGGPEHPSMNDEGNKVWDNLLLIYRTLSDTNLFIQETPLKYTL